MSANLRSDIYFFEKLDAPPSRRGRRPRRKDLPLSLRGNINPKLAAYIEKERARRKLAASSGDPAGNDAGGKEVPTGDPTPQEIASFASLAGIPLDALDSLDNIDSDLQKDSQRLMFEDCKFSAPEILHRLIKVLYLFADDLDILELPDELESDLQIVDWADLCQDVAYERREWQTDACKQMPGMPMSAVGFKSDAFSTEPPSIATPGHVTIQVSGDDQPGERAPGEGRAKRASREEDKSLLAGSRDQLGLSTPGSTMLSARRDSSARKTRLERFKGMPELQKDSSLKKHLDVRRSSAVSGMSSASLSEGKMSQHPWGVSVINFSMTSRYCEERGWIVHPNEEEDPERKTILEWARGRLQLAIRKSNEQFEYRRRNGEDKHLIIQHYGEARRDGGKMRKAPSILSSTLSTASRPLLTRSSNRLIPMPQIPELKSSSIGHRFFTQLPDGTAFVLYPAGRPAICCSTGTNIGYYTNVFSDSPDMDLLATFTPSGRGVVYHKNNAIRFLSTEKGGQLSDDEGKVTRKWKWPQYNGKLSSAVIIQISPNIIFRCVNRLQMFLYYNLHGEKKRITVGYAEGAQIPKDPEDLGFLMTSESLTSSASKEFERPRNNRRATNSKKGGMSKKRDTPKSDKRQQSGSELVKILEIPPEAVVYDNLFDRDLARLQRKVRNTLDDWLDHYRISVGIRSPMLRRLTSAPRPRSRAIASARSLPGCLPSQRSPSSRGKQQSQTDADSHQRAPSAPPHVSRKCSNGSRRSSSARVNASARILRLEGFEKSEENALNSEPSSAELPTSMPMTPNTFMRKKRLLKPEQSSDEKPSPRSGCPIALKSALLDGVATQCRHYYIPFVTDVELDQFRQTDVASGQLLVVAVISTFYPDALNCAEMLDRIYATMQKNRTKPCYQCRMDPFRLVKYDIATAADDTMNIEPLLLSRHNAVPGMFLMFMDGHLVFADHIFNGYGNAYSDFQKQIMKTKLDAKGNRFLPLDFKFSPTRGRAGPRCPWGGEIGGAGVDHYANAGLSSRLPLSRSSSASTSESNILPSMKPRRSKREPTITNFVAVTLSKAPLCKKDADTILTSRSLAPVNSSNSNVLSPTASVKSHISPNTALRA